MTAACQATSPLAYARMGRNGRYALVGLFRHQYLGVSRDTRNDAGRLWHDAAMRWPSGFICLERELLEPACGPFSAELRVIGEEEGRKDGVACNQRTLLCASVV